MICSSISTNTSKKWWNIRTADLNLYIIQKIKCAGHLTEPQQMPKKPLGGHLRISRPRHSISTHLTREMQTCYLLHKFAGLSMFQQSCRIHSPWTGFSSSFCCSSLIKFCFNQVLFKISLLLQVLFQSASHQALAAPPWSSSVSTPTPSLSFYFQCREANVNPLKIVIFFKTLMLKP